MLHPAEWAKLSEFERMIAVYNGEADSGIHWRIVRIAGIFKVDPRELETVVEIDHGWESHDKGYTHQIVHHANRMRMEAHVDG